MEQCQDNARWEMPVLSIEYLVRRPGVETHAVVHSDCPSLPGREWKSREADQGESPQTNKIMFSRNSNLSAEYLALRPAVRM